MPSGHLRNQGEIVTAHAFSSERLQADCYLRGSVRDYSSSSEFKRLSCAANSAQPRACCGLAALTTAVLFSTGVADDADTGDGVAVAADTFGAKLGTVLCCSVLTVLTAPAPCGHVLRACPAPVVCHGAGVHAADAGDGDGATGVAAATFFLTGAA